MNPGQQFPWIWELEDRGVKVKYMLGQWGHSYPYEAGRMDWGDTLLDWFDRELKGRGAFGAPVEVEDNRGDWRRANRWPDGKSQTFFLDPGNSLSRKPSDETAAEYVAADPFHTQLGYSTSSPIENQECVPNTCTYFETEPFDSDFRIAGVPRVKLSVVPTGPGGQLSVYLYAASNESMERLGWGQIDLRFASRKVEPQDVAPGEELILDFDAQPLDAVVPKGARLRVVVSSGSGWNRLASPFAFPIELGEGGGRSSLTVVSPEPPPSAFYEPQGE